MITSVRTATPMNQLSDRDASEISENELLSLELEIGSEGIIILKCSDERQKIKWLACLNTAVFNMDKPLFTKQQGLWNLEKDTQTPKIIGSHSPKKYDKNQNNHTYGDAISEAEKAQQKIQQSQQQYNDKENNNENINNNNNNNNYSIINQKRLSLKEQTNLRKSDVFTQRRHVRLGTSLLVNVKDIFQNKKPGLIESDSLQPGV